MELGEEIYAKDGPEKVWRKRSCCRGKIIVAALCIENEFPCIHLIFSDAEILVSFTYNGHQIYYSVKNLGGGKISYFHTINMATGESFKEEFPDLQTGPNCKEI